MKLPIRDQILWPLIGLLLVAVAANAIFSAWWMSARNLRSLEARQRQIIWVLEESSFPLSMNVLDKLQRLTGDELIVWDSIERRVVVGTLPTDETFGTAIVPNAESTMNHAAVRRPIGGTNYLIRAGRIRNTLSHTVFLLTSEDTIRKVSREAMWPPLAIGLATIVLLIPLTMLLASNWARRIHSLERHVGTIAEGEFGLEFSPGKIDDELARLVQSINSMSRQLLAMREQLIQGERTRLVAQLTAGFGHQLRNGLAGAKLAIQLHQSRCQSGSESSLTVARNQLALVEEEVQGLLSLGKDENRPPSQVELAQIISAVENLVSLSCQHKDIQLTVSADQHLPTVTGYADRLRAAVLNLALNAIDAVGPGGHVWLTVTSGDRHQEIVVEDDGPGPPAEMSASLFDSFVTSKPEGIGLGLTVAATVALAHHGSLSWERIGERTRFVLKLPVAANVQEIQAV